MIISQELVQEIYRVVADKSLVLGVDETMPVLLGKSAQYIVILRIQLNVVPIEVFEEVICS